MFFPACLSRAALPDKGLLTGCRWAHLMSTTGPKQTRSPGLIMKDGGKEKRKEKKADDKQAKDISAPHAI